MDIQRKFRWLVGVSLLLLGVLSSCDLQVPESVPTRITGAIPERSTVAPEQPVPEQPAPEQPAPEQPVPEQPAPEQPTAPPAPLEPIPTPPAQPDDTGWLDTLIILLVLAIIMVVFLLGRSLGHDRQRRAVEAATVAPPPPTPTIQTTVNLPAQPASMPFAAAPPAPAAPLDIQQRFVFYPGTDTIPVQDTPPIYDRSHSITVALTRTAATEEGVLLALGSMQAGYALYVQQNRLIYTHALGSVTRQIVAKSELPVGPIVIRFEFNRTGLHRGTGALFVNEQLVGAQIFQHTIPLPPAEGLDIGIDRGVPVTVDYVTPFPFLGTIQSVVYELQLDAAADISATRV